MSIFTCNAHVVKRGGLEYCGEPAVFAYKGIVSPKAGETYVHALERRGRITAELCMEHTRVTFIMMEPALRDGQATLRCLEFTRLTLICQSCHQLFRFEPLRPQMVSNATLASQSNGYFPIPNHFCPACGAPAVAEFNPELDYWEILSKDLDLPVEVTVDVYSHWMKDPKASSKFVDYIREIQAELDAEV